MRVSLRGVAGLLLSIIGNLTILALPLAHGHAHETSASAPHHAPVPPGEREIEANGSAEGHEHPDLSGRPSTRSVLVALAVVSEAAIDLPAAVVSGHAVVPTERAARARGQPSQTAPPQLRAPPTIS
jgi:hypothetical protein